MGGSVHTILRKTHQFQFTLQDFYNDIDAYFESGLPQGKKLGIIELDEKISVRGWNTADSLFYDDLKPLLQKIIDRLEKK